MMRREEVTWKVEQLDENLWLAKSSTGVAVWAESSEKLREWFSGRQAASHASRSSGESAADRCGSGSRKSRKEAWRPKGKSPAQKRFYRPTSR